MKIDAGRKLYEGHKLTEDLRLQADVVIVGSGAAGAVFAKELAEAGLDVVLLEEGGYYTAEDFNQLEHEMYPMLYLRRAGQTTKDLAVNVMQGRCLGGGTVVNMADCVRISDAVLTRWEREFGVAGLNNKVLGPSYERVEANIGVNKIEESRLNRNNQLLRAGCQKLGYRGDTFKHNRVNCVECGYCLIGCAYDAKQSTLITYIPKALDAGARVYTDAAVRQVLVEGGRAVGVGGQIIDKMSAKPLREFRVAAKLVILSAGTINTPQILFRSGLANSSGQLGRNLSLQPQAPVMAIFPEEVHGWRGIPQAWFCDQFEELSEKYGEKGFRLEGIMSQPAMGSVIMPGFGLEHKKQMARFRNSAAMLLLVPDQPAGRVTFDSEFNPSIEYEFQPLYIADLKQGLKEISRVYLAAGAEMVMLPFEKPLSITKERDLAAIDGLEVAANKLKFISAHPQGTCRMGQDKSRAVVDSRGFAHDVSQLAICDASIFPTSVSSHNMVPIMAVADYFAQGIIADREKLLK